jgi:hypothetical protein
VGNELGDAPPPEDEEPELPPELEPEEPPLLPVEPDEPPAVVEELPLSRQPDSSRVAASVQAQKPVTLPTQFMIDTESTPSGRLRWTRHRMWRRTYT